MMAKRWLVAALLLALGGCGDEADAEPVTVPVPAISSPMNSSPINSSPAPSLPAEAAPEQPAEAAPEQPQPVAEKIDTGIAGFVAIVQARMPEIAVDRRDEEIAGIARRACAALADAEEADAIVAETRTLGTGHARATNRSTARELIRLAIDTVCPDQDRRLDEFSKRDES